MATMAAKKTTKKTSQNVTLKAKSSSKKTVGKSSGQKAGASAAKVPKSMNSMPKSVQEVSSPLLGKQVPNFALPSTSGVDFNLQKFKGQNVVLYFYPKDSTPGCTLEGQCFSKLASQFKKLNTVVLGISRDSMKSHQNFKQKQNYQIDLLSDSEELACNLFDVIKEKNMYGKKVMGIVRSTFLIDAKGRLVKEWLGVKVDGHAEAVLEAVKTLS